MKRRFLATTMAISAGVVLAACGSSASAPNSAGVPSSGPGLTQPTRPSGARVSGGTVYFTEITNQSPNYIFPMYSFAYCSGTNVTQLMYLLYRPLYWYGNDYRPTVDPSYSIGRRPLFSDRDATVTVKLNPGWRWSDGEPVTSRDLVFWMNLLKAKPAVEWCGYVPGLFPDNVLSYSAPDPRTFVLHFTKPYDPEWVLYNVLSQLTPLPLAWDRTSLSGRAPTSDNGHLPDTTKAGAAAVYRFLDSQGKSTGSWTSSPLWSVVDGPFKLQSLTSSGLLTLVANRSYAGSPKPTISKLVELPFTSDAAVVIALRSGGPRALTIANIPVEALREIPSLAREGYDVNQAGAYSFTYLPLNFNSSAPTLPGGEPVRFIFRQTYFRQALQHLIDQPGWIKAFYQDTARVTCGPIPLAPPSPLVNAAELSAGPCSFSPGIARKLLSAHGWRVMPGGVSTCARAGTGVGECGAGIRAGEGISFNIDYVSGSVAIQDEMEVLASEAKKLGIAISLTNHNITSLLGSLIACQPSQPPCKWTAVYAGAGWLYGPDYLPTGEALYGPGAAVNAGSYIDPTGKMSMLINATLTGPASREAQALTAYAEYVKQQLPVLFGPSQIGTYINDAGTLVARRLGGYAANALGLMNPEDWYFTK